MLNDLFPTSFALSRYGVHELIDKLSYPSYFCICFRFAGSFSLLLISNVIFFILCLAFLFFFSLPCFVFRVDVWFISLRFRL